MCTLLCVCPPRVESLFSPVLSKSCNQIPLAFKDWISGNFSSSCQTPRLGSLMWGSGPSLQWVNFCGIIVLQFVSHPPSGYGIWLYCDCAPPTVSLRLLLCLWIWSIFFGEFQCLLVMIVQQLVVILVLLQDRVSAHPSTLPPWTNLNVSRRMPALHNCIQIVFPPWKVDYKPFLNCLHFPYRYWDLLASVVAWAIQPIPYNESISHKSC